MNKMRKITVLLVMVLVMGVLAACGRTAQMKKYEETAERIEEMAELLEPSFDAAGYVKAIMDVGLKQDFAAFVEMGLGTEEEAAQLYEKGTSSEMLIFEQLGSALGGEEKITGKLQEGLVAGRKSLKYTVGEAMEQNDGSYLVYVTCEKMNFYTRMFEIYMEKAKVLTEELADVSEEELPTQYEALAIALDMLGDSMKEAAQDATYEEPITTTVRLEVVGDECRLSQEDMDKLESYLVDVEVIEVLKSQYGR